MINEFHMNHALTSQRSFTETSCWWPSWLYVTRPLIQSGYLKNHSATSRVYTGGGILSVCPAAVTVWLAWFEVRNNILPHYWFRNDMVHVLFWSGCVERPHHQAGQRAEIDTKTTNRELYAEGNCPVSRLPLPNFFCPFCFFFVFLQCSHLPSWP